MNRAVLVFSLAELLVGAVAVFVAYVAWGYRDRPGGLPLFVMASAAVCYVLTSVSASLVAEPLLWRLANAVRYPLTMAIAAGSAYFAVDFTQREEYYHPAVGVGLGGVVALSFVAALTDPIHTLMVSEYTRTATGQIVMADGPLFWINTVVALFIILWSLALLSVELAGADGIYREQIAAIIVAFLIGIGFFLWASLSPVATFNVASVGIVGWCAMTLWGVFRFDLFETAPIARETLIESMDEAVFALDTNDRIVDLNPHAREQFSIGTDAVGQPVEDVLTEYPRLVNAIDKTDSDREITIEANGHERHFLLKLSPVYDSRRRIGQLNNETLRVGRTILLREITDRKEREQELQRQNERLDEFASVVSHDLRNPLNVASGRVELAKQECSSEHLDAAERAHERMETLIDDLLALARDGRSGDEMEAVDLQALAENCWQTVDTADATLSTETEQLLFADRQLLQQLLENLFGNAVEHGGAAVEITLGEIDDGFYVADDGPGIPADERNRVFESGYSLADDGTGLGLSIVKRVVETHGWEISVTDSADGGARFEITEIDVVT